MDIKLSTITKLSITMDETEARAFLVDPHELQAEIRRQLAIAHGGNGHRRNGKVAPAPKVAKAGTWRNTTRKASTKLVCPKCGKSFKLNGFLQRHLLKVHATAETV